MAAVVIHGSDYEARRNALIEEAELYATQLHGGEPPKGTPKLELAVWRKRWTRAYSAKMAELAQAAGL